VLSFLAGGSQPVAAVRGGVAEGRAVLYGDDSHHLDLRIETSRHGTASLHGQVVPLTESEVAEFRVCAVTVEGGVHVTRTDERGEFWLHGLQSWRFMSVVVESDEERLVVARVGGENGGLGGE
jgi:hypothetical protein